MEDQDFVQESPKKMSFSEMLVILCKYKFRMAAVFGLITVACAVVAFSADRVYQAKSTVLVKMGREYLTRPEVGDKAPVMSLTQESIIASELEIMSSRELIEKVIHALKIENLYPDLIHNPPQNISQLDAAAALFAKNLTVERVKTSPVLQVSFQHEAPDIAAKAVNLLVDFFREKHLHVFSEPQSSFLEQQLEMSLQKLNQSQDSLKKYKFQNDVFSLEEQRSLLLKQKMELDTILKQCINQIGELQNKSETFRSQLQELSSKEQARDQLEKSNVKEIDLVAAYIKEQDLEANDRSKIKNQLYQETYKEQLRVEAELGGLKVKQDSIRKQLSALSKQIGDLNLSEQEIENLKREKSLHEKNYQALLERTEESRLVDEMNRRKLTNISVIQAAVPPAEAVKSKKMKILLIGVVSGIVIAVATAFLSDWQSQVFLTPEKAERLLGVPVLVTLPCREQGREA